MLKSKMKGCKSQEWRDISYRNNRLKDGVHMGMYKVGSMQGNVCKHFREKDQG